MIDPRAQDSRSIKYHVNKYLLSISSELRDKKVIDMPAGSGSTTEILLKIGAKVEAFDLFPQYFKLDGFTCSYADIATGIPVYDHYADWLICQEGLEHFSDQIKALREFNRVLKPKGKLLVTVPSYSNLSAKISYLLFESENNKDMPQNELCDVWMSDKSSTNGDTNIYYGHIFMIGLQKLRTLARLSGFKILENRYVRLSKGSLLLMPFFYPLIVLHSLRCYYRNIRKHPNIPMSDKAGTFREQLIININPLNLINKHLFIVFQKEYSLQELACHLKASANLYPFDKVM